MKNFINGMSRVLDVGSVLDNFKLEKDPWIADAKAIAGDWNVVGKCIYDQIERLEELEKKNEQ